MPVSTKLQQQIEAQNQQARLYELFGEDALDDDFDIQDALDEKQAAEKPPIEIDNREYAEWAMEKVREAELEAAEAIEELEPMRRRIEEAEKRVKQQRARYDAIVKEHQDRAFFRTQRLRDGLIRYVAGEIEGKRAQSIKFVVGGKVGRRKKAATANVYDEGLFTKWAEENGHGSLLRTKVSIDKKELNKLVRDPEADKPAGVTVEPETESWYIDTESE